MKLPIYNQKGEKMKEMELNPQIFNVKTKPHIIQQAVLAQQANTRVNIAHAKGRAEVRGGGRKPWRQKGTGRARHGSSRSPIWRGGGVTFGPSIKQIFSKKINKKIKKQALLMCLSEKAEQKNIKILDTLKLPTNKTKQISTIIQKLKIEKQKIMLVLDQYNDKIIQSARNIQNISLVSADSLNTIEVLKNDLILTTEKGIKKIQTTYIGSKK